MNLTEPLLTVIVPIYNVKKYLDRCLKSLIIENNLVSYILINDGSTDGSNLIAKSWSERYSNVYYISQKNGGLSSARNAGLKHVKSKWVYFADSDDYVTKKFIVRMIEILKKTSKTTLLTLPVLRVVEDKSQILQNGTGELTIDEFILDLIHGKRQFGVWSYVFNVDNLRKNKLVFENGKLFEDQYFIPNYLKTITRICRISDSEIGYYNYCIRKNSISNSNLSDSLISSKCESEIYRDNVLKEITKNKKIKILILQNKITVLFRAYLDSLKINNENNAKKYKSKIFFFLRNNDLGRLTFKHQLKIIMLCLPKKLTLKLAETLNR